MPPLKSANLTKPSINMNQSPEHLLSSTKVARAQQQIPNTNTVDNLKGEKTRIPLAKPVIQPTLPQSQSTNIKASDRLGRIKTSDPMATEKSVQINKTNSLSGKNKIVDTINKSIDKSRIVTNCTAAADEKLSQTVIANRDTGEMEANKSTVSTIKSETIDETVKYEKSKVTTKPGTNDSTGLVNKLKTFFKL